MQGRGKEKSEASGAAEGGKGLGAVAVGREGGNDAHSSAPPQPRSAVAPLCSAAGLCCHMARDEPCNPPQVSDTRLRIPVTVFYSFRSLSAFS